MVDSDAGYSIKYWDYISAITLASNNYWKSMDPPGPNGKEIKESKLKQKAKLSKHYTSYAYDKVKVNLKDDTVSIDRIEAARKLVSYTFQLNFVHDEQRWLPKNEVDFDEMTDYLASNIEVKKVLMLAHHEMERHYSVFLEKIREEEQFVFLQKSGKGEEFRSKAVADCNADVFDFTRKKINEQTFEYWQRNIRDLILVVGHFYLLLERHVCVEKEYDMKLLPLDDFFDIFSPLEGGNYISDNNN